MVTTWWVGTLPFYFLQRNPKYLGEKVGSSKNGPGKT
jgi:hypothetical protein